MTSKMAELFPWTASAWRTLWPPRPARRKRWVVLAGVVLLLLAVHTLWVAIASSRLLAVSERVAERWGPMPPGSLAPPAVPDRDNAAKPVRAAAEMLSLPDAVMGLQRRATVRDFGGYAGDDPEPGEIAAMRRVVADNELAFAILDEAVGRPGATWDLRYRGGISAEVPDLRAIIDLAKVNVAVGRLALRDGDIDGVLRALVRGEAMERSLAHEPMVIIQMTRTAIQRLRMALLREWLATGPVGLSHVEAAARAVGRSDLSLKGAFIGEAKVMVDAMLGKGRGSLAPWSEGFADGVLTDALRGLVKPVVLDNVRFYIELMDRMARCAGQVRYQRLPECEEGADPGDGSAYHFIARMMLFNFPGVLARADMAVARVELATLALALERHRLKEGVYPEGLADLTVPAGGSGPIDPLTGGAFAYERTSNGYRLLSRGLDETLRASEAREDVSMRAPDPVLDWRIEPPRPDATSSPLSLLRE